MVIKIIKQDDVEVTQAEYDRLSRECVEHNRFTTNPLSVEEYIRRHKNLKNRVEPFVTFV